MNRSTKLKVSILNTVESSALLSNDNNGGNNSDDNDR